MIAYDLKCPKGHDFEGWFDSSEAYEEQLDKKLVSCPVCGSTKVKRTPSVFGISKRYGQDMPELRHPGEMLQQFFKENFEDVGADFAKEALKIHYNVEKKRNIRGVSTAQEEETLQQEGVEFFKLPNIIDQAPDDEQ